jgi:iron complex outermembrane receptor protein
VAPSLNTTVVTATRVEQNSFDVPASIDVTDREVIQDGQGKMNLSETAVRIPGVIVNNRNNAAQDLAIQIRGFGARSSFGVRGVRLYADGIPMTMPDGQGQTGTFNLDTASRIEYLKGPFSAMYGNSSGGVVQIFTKDGPKDPTAEGAFTFGSYNTFRESVTVGGTEGNVNYNLNASTYKTDGYRDYSNLRRDLMHGKIKIDLSDSTKLTVVATTLNQPDSLDPQGLSASDLATLGPKAANPKSLEFKTRVTKRHEQVGATLEHKLSENDHLSFMAYVGHRFNSQFQSTSVFSQKIGSFPTSPGGVAEYNRDFGGTDIHWTHKGSLVDLPYQFVAGVNYDRMNDDRQGYENFVRSSGSSNSCSNISVTCGVKGALRRNENNIAFNFDQYMQGNIDLTKKWSVSGGVRNSRVNFKNEDHYIAADNPDDSGSVTFKKTTPMLGTLYKLNDSINLFANVGKSFETPTFAEMSYKLSGSGLNFDLKPAESDQYELGIKAALTPSTLINASIYKINTKNEISLAQQSSGRSVYQNIPTSERKGFEVALDSKITNDVRGYVAYSYIDAKFTSSFNACRSFALTGGTTCVASTPSNIEKIASGAEIPGTYKNTLYGELAYKYDPLGFSGAVEGRAFSKTNVAFNETYGKASGYAVAAVRGGFTQKVSNWNINEFLRVDNIFDKNYIGSVRIADLNGSYYEPAAGRNWLMGINASYAFK